MWASVLFLVGDNNREPMAILLMVPAAGFKGSGGVNRDRELKLVFLQLSWFQYVLK